MDELRLRPEGNVLPQEPNCRREVRLARPALADEDRDRRKLHRHVPQALEVLNPDAMDHRVDSECSSGGSTLPPCSMLTHTTNSAVVCIARQDGRDPPRVPTVAAKLLARACGSVAACFARWHGNHDITVEQTEAPAEKGRYPRVLEKHGRSPPQYPDLEEEEQLLLLPRLQPDRHVHLPAGAEDPHHRLVARLLGLDDIEEIVGRLDRLPVHSHDHVGRRRSSVEYSVDERPLTPLLADPSRALQAGLLRRPAGDQASRCGAPVRSGTTCAIPMSGRATCPFWISCGTTRAMVLTGMANPTPALSPVLLAMAVFMPIIRAWLSSSGPPELPGLIAASIWMICLRPPVAAPAGQRAVQAGDDARW